MPSNLLNTQGTIGYDDSLKRMTVARKLGVNKLNLKRKSVGVRHMNEGSLKFDKRRSEESKPLVRLRSSRPHRGTSPEPLAPRGGKASKRHPSNEINATST